MRWGARLSAVSSCIAVSRHRSGPHAEQSLARILFVTTGGTVRKEFRPVRWDQRTLDDCRQLIRLAVREDLDRGYDLTTVAIVEATASARAEVVFREPGIMAGIPVIDLLIQEMNLEVTAEHLVEDGTAVSAGTVVSRLAGDARDLLTAERLLLNFLGRLSGVATLTRRYVDAIEGTNARVYDTRKTTPGWRRLEKYAVRCGGGCNHRTGLFDAFLIKDNHLAAQGNRMNGPVQALAAVHQHLQELSLSREDIMICVEVDTLDQFDQVLPHQPDIILLDNMDRTQLREAVQRRDAARVTTELEASGGITLETIRGVAETGVDRISVGALTRMATTLDVALDWSPG